jgi:AraC family transcriptional regulator
MAQSDDGEPIPMADRSTMIDLSGVQGMAFRSIHRGHQAMADGNRAVLRGNDPPVVSRLASAAFGGLTATLIRNEPGIFDTGAWPDHRVILQTSRDPIRAHCRCDGQSLDHIQSYGDFVIQPAETPGVWRDYGSAEMLMFAIAPRFVRETAEGLDMNPDRAGLTLRLHARDPQVEHIALAMKAGLASGGELPRLYGKSLSVALVARLLSRFESGVRPYRHGLSPRQLRSVIDYIAAHLDEDLALEQLAAVAGASVSHFTVLFRRSTGRSAHRYVVERRVEAARTLLMETRLPIAQVALETGFAHQSHLTRCMRRLTGLTPGEIVRSR